MVVMGNSARSWTRWVVVLAVIAVVGVIPRPASADPVPTTITLQTGSGSGPGRDLVASITTAGAGPFAGDGRVQSGRRRVGPGRGLRSRQLRPCLLPPGAGTLDDRAVTADYLGSEGLAAGSVTSTITFPALSTIGLPTSGSVSIGQAVLPVATPLVYTDTPYDPLIGAIALRNQRPMLTTTVPTPEGGTASIGLRFGVRLRPGSGVGRHGHQPGALVLLHRSRAGGRRRGDLGSQLQLGFVVPFHHHGTRAGDPRSARRGDLVEALQPAQCSGFSELLNSVPPWSVRHGFHRPERCLRAGPAAGHGGHDHGGRGARAALDRG